MRTFLALFVPFFLLASPLFAQSGDAIITGRIVNQQQQPIPSASVAVFDSAQTFIVTGAASDSAGSFKIDIEEGSYVLRVTFISFKAFTKPFTVNARETKNFGEIILEPTAESLGEVVVQGERSQMQMNFDKRVFNVGQDLTSMGGSALNVLNNVPSVITDIDGNISLRGNESVRVLINGKPSSRVKNGDVSALRSIPSNMIKKVEIITNPSAKYSAEGSGGIINIVMKKERDRGLNGNISVGTGFPSDHELSTNLNYRVDNINWFFGSSVDYRSDPEEGSSFRRFSSPDTAYMYYEATEASESEIDANINFGADFFLSENEILTASTYLEMENGENSEDAIYTYYDYAEGAIYSNPGFNADVVGLIYRDDIEESNEKQFEFNLEYENRYDGDKHKLTAEADFDISRQSVNSSVTERVDLGGENPLNQRIQSSEGSMDFRAEVDYIQPLGEKGKLEAGARSSFEWMDNSYRLQEQEGNTWMTQPSFNNNFIYKENVNSAYLIMGSEHGAFSAQLGLRLENTRIYTELKTDGDNPVEKNYTGLFPSVFLNYSFNEQQSVQLSYSRRLNRPWSRMLLPFTDYSNSRSRSVGNPRLMPEYSNSFEAGYLHYWESGSVLTSFYYRHRTDVIDRITIPYNEITLRFPINLATEEAWGVEFSADQEIIDGLTLTGNANFYTSASEGSYRLSQIPGFGLSGGNSNEIHLLTSDTETFQARLGIRWRINEEWNFQTSSRYRAPHETTQGQRAAMTMMDAGLARELFDGQATLSLSVRDILNSRNYESTIITDNFYSHRQFRWSSRSFSLNFTYHFGRPERRRR